jgi:hypothetical protein
MAWRDRSTAAFVAGIERQQAALVVQSNKTGVGRIATAGQFGYFLQSIIL